MRPIRIEQHNSINVLRDDFLPGGTKSVIVDTLPQDHVIYASPVYGGFQIALAAQLHGMAHIFCAERKVLHPNTLRCIEYGAQIHQVEHGYLSVVEKAAREYAGLTKFSKITFGAAEHKKILVQRVKKVIEVLGNEPEEIWCAIGSGTLFEAILEGTTTAKVIGVTVGKYYENWAERAGVYHHYLKFEKPSTFPVPFPSMPNYDLKAWEYCNKYSDKKDVLFWNVL